uniref:Sugar phosphate transporter domain-containing protein n=1 Tax=Compsopogon caeruleus TaxID=31354 RepID=A0A7S1T9V3_9RHOD
MTARVGGQSRIRLIGWSEIEILLCALGIYVCYIRYGILHEKLFKTPYEPDGAHFRYPTGLIGIQCVMNALFAALPGLVLAKQPLTTPMWKFAGAALTYMSAMLFSFMALQHMSYPMQALGKSSKMIPVMLMGIVIRGKKYKLRDYLCVGLITGGVLLFSMKKASAGTDSHSSPMGMTLLCLSLLMDGLTGPVQEKIVEQHNPTSHQLMFYQNLFSIFWIGIVLGITGEFGRTRDFLLSHPTAVRDVLYFGLASAIGQNFIFYTVRNISALACTTITTTRKFFTILISILWFKHKLSLRQMFAVGMVFSGIIWEAVSKHRARMARSMEKAKTS